jgi:hypothetical protein
MKTETPSVSLVSLRKTKRHRKTAKKMSNINAESRCVACAALERRFVFILAWRLATHEGCVFLGLVSPFLFLSLLEVTQVTQVTQHRKDRHFLCVACVACVASPLETPDSGAEPCTIVRHP